MEQIDFAFTVKLQDAIDKLSMLRVKSLIGDVMEGSTFFASPGVSVVWVIILIILSVVNFKKKKIRWRGFVIPILFLFLTLVEIYGKSVVHHPAPPFFMIKNPTTLFPKYYINEQFSYPSGHAARAVFIALCSYLYLTFLTPYFKRKTRKILIGLGLVCYVGIVSISRIYLGHHWVSDVLGGLLLGSGLSLFTVKTLYLDD